MTPLTDLIAWQIPKSSGPPAFHHLFDGELIALFTDHEGTDPEWKKRAAVWHLADGRYVFVTTSDLVGRTEEELRAKIVACVDGAQVFDSQTELIEFLEQQVSDPAEWREAANRHLINYLLIEATTTTAKKTKRSKKAK